ncbi:MAG: hypothetical protein IJ752_03745 [Alphaproteobacteria bacterium]|nr:hypothetical protein [Alphaproteobacteria bacterium]
MNSFFKTTALFFCLTLTAGAQTLDIQTGHEMKRIAFSAKTGVEVFAEASAGKWCENILSLKIFAQDETVFSEKSLNALMTKVGLVLNGECPESMHAIIDGYSSNTLVFQGSASAADKWKPEKGTLKVKIQQLQAAAVKTSQNDFSSKEWAPPANKQKIIAHIDSKTALEHRLYSKDKACSILYTTDKPAEKLKKWFISVGGNSCSENLIYGRAEVSLFNEKGHLETTLDGYFTEGRFTGKKNLNVVLLNRYGANKNDQVLSYLIDSDQDLKINYVSYLKSQRNPKTGFYSAWSGCSPFTIAAVTENEELFLESAITDNILRTAQSYADIFCPGATQMKFFATTVPQNIPGMDMPAASAKKEASSEEDPRLIYAASLQRSPGKKWKIISDKTQNLARLRENARRTEDLREHQLMMADYNELTKTDYLGRLAYMIGTDRIDNLPAMLTAAAIIQKPIRVNLLVNVSSLGLDQAWADWPSEFLITQTSGLLNRPGWHIVSGNLRLMTDQEKKEYKKTDLFSSGLLELSAAAACEQEVCGEVSDLIGLIRRRHEKPNWQPYHAPYRQKEES